MVKLDDTDRKIINLLREDSRRPFTEIAEKIGVSEGTVRKRVNCLKDEGVIKKYSVELDPSKLGYEMVSILGLGVDPQNLLKVVDQIREFDEVKWAAKSTGDHMIMAEIWAKDAEELSKIISEKIGQLDGVRDLKPSILLEKKNKGSNCIS